MNDIEEDSTISIKIEAVDAPVALSVRYILKFINSLSEQSVITIDNRITKMTSKHPLLLYAAGSGLISSLSTSFIKGVAEQIGSGEVSSTLGRPMIYILLVLVNVSLVYQLNFMNMALKYYEQLEIVPIY